jgi:hypothetical protein
MAIFTLKTIRFLVPAILLYLLAVSRFAVAVSLFGFAVGTGPVSLTTF